MKVKELKKIFTIANRVKTKNTVEPILECAKFKNGIMSVTDLTVMIQQDVSEFTTDTFIIELAYIHDVVRKLKATDDLKAELIGHQLCLKINGEIMFEFRITYQVDDFPNIATLSTNIGAFSGANLKRALKYSCTDDTRPAMCGAHIDEKHIVATDAHKLLFVKHHRELVGKPFTIPSAALKLVDDKQEYLISLCDDEKYRALQTGSTTIIFRVIDEKYPNYRDVIPKDNPHQIKMNAKEMIDTLNLALLAANSETKMVKFDFLLDEVKVSSEDIDRNKQFARQIPFSGVLEEGLTIGFNGAFVIECLKDFDNTVTITASTPNRAVIFNDEVMLMPMLLP